MKAVFIASLEGFGSVLLEGQRVVPAKLLEHGFVFQYPKMTGALREVLEVSS